MKKFAIIVEDLSCDRPDGTKMAMRVARPKGDGPFPAVIDIHGGGWVSGDRTQNAVIDDFLASEGIVAVAPEFRMPPAVQYPVPISDVALAMCWLKSHASALSSRPELVGGVGTSSGGHQLLEYALRPNHPAYSDQVGASTGTSVAYLVVCWPVADPLRRFHFARERKNEQLLKAHSLYWPSEAAMEAGNPQLVLERGQHAALPPLLIIQGGADDNLPIDSAQRLASAWTQRGGFATLEVFDGQPHTFVTRAPETPSSQQALTRMAQFIRECARPDMAR